MAIKLEPADLPKATDVAAAKPLLEKLAKRSARLEKVTAAATTDGKHDRQDPKVRAARSKVKKLQRAIRKQQLIAGLRAKQAKKTGEAAAAS